MNDPKRAPKRNFVTPVALALALALAPALALAQTSTLDLKTLCENNAGNVVAIDGPVLIHQGAPASAPQQVASGCTLVIGPFGKFEAKEIGMRFAGALNIQSAHKGFVSLSDSSLAGTSVNVSMTGSDSVLLLTESNFQSTSGNVNVTMGPIAKIELVDILPFQPFLMSSAGTLNISGSEKFTVTMKGGNLQAASGLTIDMSGTDTLLLADGASMITSGGALNMSASQNKGTMTLNQGSYRAGGSVNVVLAGAESSLMVKDADVRSNAGSIAFNAGSAGTKGKLEVSQSRFNAPGSLSLFASRSADFGFVSVDNVELNGAGGVRVETGASGGTYMKNSRVTSSTLFHILTGLGGVCLQSNNLITSPDQRLCF